MFLVSNKVLKRSLAMGLSLAILFMGTIGTGIVVNAYAVSPLNTDFQSYNIGDPGGFVNTVAGSVSVQMDPGDSSNTNKVLKLSGANGATATYTFSPFVTGNVHIVTAKIYMKSTATVHSRLFQGYCGAIGNGTRTGYLGVDAGRFLPSGNVFNGTTQLYFTAGNWYNVTMAFKSYLATPTYDLLIEGPGMTYNGAPIFQASKQNIAYQNTIATGHDLEYMRLTNTAVGTDGTDDIYIDDLKVATATAAEYTAANADADAISLGTTTNLTQNLVLPTTGGVNSSAITWTSLDSNIISSGGTIHPQEATKSTYLFATVNYGGVVVKKSYLVSVKGTYIVSERFEAGTTFNFASPVAPWSKTNVDLSQNITGSIVADPDNSANNCLAINGQTAAKYWLTLKCATGGITGDLVISERFRLTDVSKTTRLAQLDMDYTGTVNPENPRVELNGSKLTWCDGPATHQITPDYSLINNQWYTLKLEANYNNSLVKVSLYDKDGVQKILPLYQLCPIKKFGATTINAINIQPTCDVYTTPGIIAYFDDFTLQNKTYTATGSLKLVLSNLTFFDADTNSYYIYGGPKNKGYIDSVEVTKMTSDPITGKLVVAIYKGGILASMQTVDLPTDLVKGVTSTVNVGDIQLPADVTGYSVKVFAFTDLTHIAPLSTPAF